MQFQPTELTGDLNHILSVFTKHVTNYQEKDSEKSGKTPTQLKVFVTENSGYTVGNLNRVISQIAERPNLHKNTQKYISNHNFRERVVEDNISYVEIETPEVGRTDQFIFLNNKRYLKILTAERRKWTKKTVERLVDYVPDLDPVLLSPSDLERVVENLDGAFISGFTAKYYSYKDNRRISIQVHGGSEEDLSTIKEEFNAKPTRIEFNQRNSPTDTVRSAIAQEGHYSISSIQPGYEQKGIETITYLFQELSRQDEKNFKIDFVPERVRVGTGSAILGYTTIELANDSDNDSDPETLSDRLRRDILESKNRYAYSSWEQGKFEVFDKETSEPFEITLESETIRIHAKEGTTSASTRVFCSYIYEILSPTYKIKKLSEGLKA